MKIAIYYHTKLENFCGTGILINTAIEFAKQGNQVDLYTPSALSHRFNSDLNIVNYHPNKIFTKLNFTSGWGLIDIVLRIYHLFLKKYDIIYCHCGHRPSSLIPALTAKYMFKTKIIEEWWEWFGKGGLSDSRKSPIGKVIGLYDRIFELPAKKIYDGVICISSILQDRISNLNNSIVLYGAINSKQLKKVNIHDARKLLNINNEIIIIGLINVGYEDHEDNISFLRSFKNIVKKNKDVRLFITGDKNYIEKEVQKIIRKDFLIIPGWLKYEDYSNYLNACNILILPFPDRKRNLGRYPNKLGDFLYIGRTIISNPTGDVGAILKEVPFAILCKNDENVYYNQITNLINNKKTSWESSTDNITVNTFNERAEKILLFFKKIKNV